MIARNETRQQQRAIERAEAKAKAKHGKANMQAAMNNILWKIVVNNKGKMEFPISELRAIPPEAGLHGRVIGDNFVIESILHQPDLILPCNGLII